MVCIRVRITIVVAVGNKVSVALIFVLKRFKQRFSDLFGDLRVLARNLSDALAQFASRTDIRVG